MSEDTSRFLESHICKRRRPVNLRPADDELFSAEFTREIGSSLIERSINRGIIGTSLLAEGCRHPLNPAFFRDRVNLGAGLRTGIRTFVHDLVATLIPRQLVDSGIWVANEWSHGYFHWLTEALTRIELARICSIDSPVLLPAELSRFSFIGQSLDHLRIPYRYLSEYRMTNVTEIVLPRSEIVTGNYNCFLLRSLAARFHVEDEEDESEMESGPVPVTPRRIWVSRALANKRKITNEEELKPLLDSHGFEVVRLENYSFSEQVRLFRNTSIIAGLHGAGLTNMLFMPSGADVIEVRRKGDTHSNCYYSMASSLNLNYYYLLADSLSDDLHADDCVLSPDLLDDLLSKVGHK